MKTISGVALALALAPTLGGCLCLPVPLSTDGPGARGAVVEKDVAVLEDGVSTLEQAVLELGEPDYADATHLGYAWCESRTNILWGWILPAGHSAVGGAGICRLITYGYLVLEFDSNQQLTRSRIHTCRGTIDGAHLNRVKQLFDVLDDW